jgi:hypothetical protein
MVGATKLAGLDGTTQIAVVSIGVALASVAMV